MKMRLRKTMCGLLLLVLAAAIAGCGKNDSRAAATEVPVDLVSEIADAVSEEKESQTAAMDETVQKNYQVLLDGTSDSQAVYYLVDVTGNGSPELIVGVGTMNVYSCNQGAVTTIGSMAIDTAYLSQQYGFLAFNHQQDQYELIRYKYDGEMIVENILVSASSDSDYSSQASAYLSDARELTAYALSDRTPFDNADNE